MNARKRRSRERAIRHQANLRQTPPADPRDAKDEEDPQREEPQEEERENEEEEDDEVALVLYRESHRDLPSAKRWRRSLGGDKDAAYEAYLNVMDIVAENARRGVDVSRDVDELTTVLVRDLDLDDLFPRIVGLSTDPTFLFCGCIADHGDYVGVTDNHNDHLALRKAAKAGVTTKNAHRLRINATPKFFQKTVASFHHDSRIKKGNKNRGECHHLRQRALAKAIFDITRAKPTLVFVNGDALPFFGRGSHHGTAPLKDLFHKIRFESDYTAILVFIGSRSKDLLYDPQTREPLKVMQGSSSLHTHDGRFRSGRHVLAENTLNIGLRFVHHLSSLAHQAPPVAPG